MDYLAAKRLILLHGPGVDGEEPGILDDGFLGTLRPCRGIREEHFHSIMEALFVVGEHFHREDKVDRQLIHGLWDLCNIARCWAMTPESMLQRNNLISQEDLQQLTTWVDCIERVTLGFLRGLPPRYEIETYAQYIIDFGAGENIAYFIRHMIDHLCDEDFQDYSVVAEALGKLGATAREALPTLRSALQREYSFYSPVDVCTSEVRGYIRDAIERIET